jgi:hypothetical protein
MEAADLRGVPVAVNPADTSESIAGRLCMILPERPATVRDDARQVW